MSKIKGSYTLDIDDLRPTKGFLQALGAPSHRAPAVASHPAVAGPAFWLQRPGAIWVVG